jgi:hypothetical protein
MEGNTLVDGSTENSTERVFIGDLKESVGGNGRMERDSNGLMSKSGYKERFFMEKFILSLIHYFKVVSGYPYLVEVFII